MPDQPEVPASAKVIPLRDQDWRSDYIRIIGEPYSLHGWLLRLHPDDVVSSIRGIVRGGREGRIELVYRIRGASGEYVRVRGSVRLLFGEWVGVIYALGRKDSATPATIARHLVCSVRNGVAPWMVLSFVECFRWICQ